MEQRGTCFYLVDVNNPDEALNECHRMPPKASDVKSVAAYPIVKNYSPGCGEWMPKEAGKINDAGAA